MKVITVTLNPSLERTLIVHYLAVGYHNHTTQTTSLAPAGRGVNISRALHALEVPTEALILLGDDATGTAYRALVDAEQLPVRIVRVTGQTRSQIVLLDTGNKSETVIAEDNEGFSRSEVVKTAEVMKAMIEPEDYVVYAGPLPQGIPAETYIWLIEQAVEAGAKVILDIPLEALKQGIRARPAMAFMTQGELESYFNFPVRVKEDVIYCAHKLREEGAENVLVLLNSETGAILATAEETLSITYPAELEFGTHSGTVAAMIAGYCAGQIKDRALDKSLRLGMSAAIYAIQQVGTTFPNPAALPEYMRQVEITQLSRVDQPISGVPPLAPPAEPVG